MAIYHASIKAFSRGKGESSVAAAAYRAGLDILDTHTKQLHRYSFRKGVAAHFMLAPAGAPAWCDDPSVFWDANEAWETRSNARVAHELEVSLPHDLSEAERQALALELGQILVDRYKAVVLVAIHAPSVSGDNRNHHVHLLMSARQVGPEGFGARAGAEFSERKGRGAEEIRRVRELVSDRINARLAAAGLEDRVDHRTLKAQAIDARLKGDFKQAKLLSRLPGKHMGRAITAALRRGDPSLVDRDQPVATPAQSAMDRAVEAFNRAGRLMSTSEGHTASVARAERARESVSRPSFKLPDEPTVDRELRKRITKHGASRLALDLSRHARLTRAEGKGAHILNTQAKLIEEWLENLQETARVALRSLEEIPGMHIEPCMREAMETALRPRVAIYAEKRFFFEDSEALVAAIVDYAGAMVVPHRARERLGRAQAAVVSFEIEGIGQRDPKMASAKRSLTKAKDGVSRPARIVQDRRIQEARREMEEARAGIERDFYITPLDRVQTCPPHPYAAEIAGKERKSDSNRVQLRPRSGMCGSLGGR